MTRFICLIMLLGVTAGLAVSEDLKFGRTWVINSKGGEDKVDLVFSEADSALVVRKKDSVFAQIPFAAIERISYGYSKHHRLDEGVQTMVFPFLNPASGIIGGIVMLTKGKRHWLYIDYKDPEEVSRELVLRLDKSVYRKVLEAAKVQTGIDVEILPEEGDERDRAK